MDIHALFNAADTGNSTDPAVDPPKRRWLTRVLLPTLVLLLVCGLLVYASRDTLRPTRTVCVVRVVAKEGLRSDHKANMPATVSVQAPGWVEPDPYTIFITALTNGVIEKIHVLEGQPVASGQVVAEMVDADARLAVARFEAAFNRRHAILQAAQTDWENPIALERAVAVNQSFLAEAMAELSQLDASIAQQKAKLNGLKAAHDRLKKLLPNAAAELEVEQAQYRLEAQAALLEVTRKQAPVMEAKVTRYQAEFKAAEADLRLRVGQRNALDGAKAAVAEAQALLDDAKLHLERMKIVSPVSGIVMARLVAPGAKLMLDMDLAHSSHVLHVYDPKKLQVRVDVPLADAAKVAVEQRARVIVDVLPESEFSGVVTRFVHQADISKNTVEVKVAIDDPSPLLKPDMLARVKFLAFRSSRDGKGTAVSALTLYAPRKAVHGEDDDAHVWLVTPGESRLRRQPVTVGSKRDDGWVEVIDGLQPGDVLVDEPTGDLQEGQRVAVAGEDRPDDGS